MTRFGKPSSGSPSRTTGNHSLFCNSWQRFQDIPRMHWGVTLPASVETRNKKFMLSCAEPVEDETSLWKAKENAENTANVKNTKVTPRSKDENC
jgi:hypothetical protein